MISVINKHHTFYIGRGSPLGNPFVIGTDGDREFCIEEYRKYLLQKIKEKDKVICDELNKIYKSAKDFDVQLQCYCKGFQSHCHGDVILDIILSKAKKQGVIESFCEDKSFL